MIGAVEAGGTKFVAVLARPDGTIVDRARIATRDPAVTFADVVAFFEQSSTTHGQIEAFGIASFGPLDLDHASPEWGCWTTTPKPGWPGASWPQALERFAAPLAIDTDVNGAALAEARAAGTRSLAYTTVGTGIGTGVVKDGRALLGFGHYEAGHIVPPQPEPTWPGACPVHGACLEGLASGTAIMKRWGKPLSELGAEEVRIVAETLAELAAMLVLLHMPERIVFGGGVMHTPGLVEALRSATERRLAGYIASPFLDPGLETYITTPKLGDDAGITGAVMLAQTLLGPETSLSKAL
jgi:fructokinase